MLSNDVLLFGAVFAVGVLWGYAVGRPWVALLAFLIPLAAVSQGQDSHAAHHWVWAAYLLVAPALLGLIIGVRERRRRRKLLQPLEMAEAGGRSGAGRVADRRARGAHARAAVRADLLTNARIATDVMAVLRAHP